MTDHELLEHILYELRLANWQRAGGKRSGQEPPTPPATPDETTVRTFGGRAVKVTNTYNIHGHNTDEVIEHIKRSNPGGAA